jgi:glycosyltransferase involved in cell wall biosynthesis
MKVLWICGLPEVVQQQILSDEECFAKAAWSWIVAHLPPPRNVELHLACLCPGRKSRKRVEYEGAQIHLLPCPTRGRALLLFQRDTAYFRPIFSELRPDIVHGWGTEDSYGLAARRLAPVHHVIGIQGLISSYRRYLPKTFRTLLISVTERLTLSKARNVVAESRYSLEAAAPLCPQAAMNVVEHPLRSEFLTSTPTDGTDKTVLFVGRIQERKGISETLQAFARVAPPDWKLHCVGQGTPEEEAAMHALAVTLKIDSRFRHSRTLAATDLVRAMQESSIFLLPTHVDTGPTVLKESLAMGLWPVCYDNSGPGEYVRKYRFGSLAKDRDLNSLCTELGAAIVKAPWMEAGRRVALERHTRSDFSRDNAWNRLTELYQDILSQ